MDENYSYLNIKDPLKWNRDFMDFGYEKEWPGVVLDIDDPLKKGRIRASCRFYAGLETEDIPWAHPRENGREFQRPDLNKVINLMFPNGDLYHPEYTYAEHYNINLQEKLDSLGEDAYRQFRACNFDAKWQLYADDVDEGMILDYVKTKMQILPNGDMILNLRNNNRTLFLGSEGADQSAVLGDHFMTWFDKFAQNLIGGFGGPYIGNLMAPTLPNPAMLKVMNEYFAIRSTFLSQHVKVVDNLQVQENNRGFDQEPEGDNYLDGETNRGNE